MIKQIIQQVVENSLCQFRQFERPSDGITFYCSGNPEYQRFLVVLDAELLSSPYELNSKVQESTPPELLKIPSFSKNTDLVVLYKLDSLAELHQYEHSIFDIEENAYSLKKHVLYYTTSESEQLGQYLTLGEAIETLVVDPVHFNQYKIKPTEETAFSLACRLYVKLPFLAVPAKEATLTSANQLANQLLDKHNLHTFFNEIEQQLSVGQTHEEVMEALINAQVAN